MEGCRCDSVLHPGRAGGTLILSIAVFALAACGTYLFPMGISGSRGGVAFSVLKERGVLGLRGPPCADMVTVSRPGRNPIWLMRRKGPCPTVTSFVYGVVPPGWVEEVPAEPLAPGIVYDVYIGAQGGAAGGKFLSDGTRIGEDIA